jgi:hypothetical protein
MSKKLRTKKLRTKIANTSPCPTSVRLFLLMITVGLFATHPSAAAQTANIPQVEIPGGGYRIAGTAMSKTDGRPLAHARIFVRDVKNRQKFQSVVTSENGKFEFSGRTGRSPV